MAATVRLSGDLVGLELPDATWSWSWREAVLYALGIGARPGPGALAEPEGDEGDLDFLYEKRGPQVYPTFAVIPGMTALGGLREVVQLELSRMLHGEQGITLHRPLPGEGTVTVKGRVVEVWDKGTAAVIGVESELVDDDGPLATTYASLFAKGYGGFGGERGPDTSERHRPPDRPADHAVGDDVHAEQAALYRLSGDRVPLHVDPSFARKAGYPGPFLHGLCTYGFAGRAVLRALCGNDPARLISFRARFADLVWMGDRITTKIWIVGDGEATVQSETQDGKIVLSQAHARFFA